MDPTNQYQDVFQRYEQKYLLQEKQYRIIRRELKTRIVPDQGTEKVQSAISIFDTPDFRIVLSCLAKPVYKEKSSACAVMAFRGEEHGFCGTEERI